MKRIALAGLTLSLWLTTGTTSDAVAETCIPFQHTSDSVTKYDHEHDTVSVKQHPYDPKAVYSTSCDKYGSCTSTITGWTTKACTHYITKAVTCTHTSQISVSCTHPKDCTPPPVVCAPVLHLNGDSVPTTTCDKWGYCTTTYKMVSCTHPNSCPPPPPTCSPYQHPNGDTIIDKHTCDKYGNCTNTYKQVACSHATVPTCWPRPNATFHVIYLHGARMGSWPKEAQILNDWLPADWDVRNPEYNGSKRLNDSGVNSAIKTHLRTYCRGTHSCVVVAHSAGNNRFLKANKELIAEGTPLTNLLYVSSISSAGGGTAVARYTTKWWKKLLAKLFGKYAPIDEDLHDTDWTGGQYTNMQNLITRPVWHVGAGNKDMCVKIKILFWKLKFCGNKEMPSKKGDGAVPVFSACGFSSRTAYQGCNSTGSKWTNRLWDTLGSPYYLYENHTGMFVQGSGTVIKRIVGLTKSVTNASSLVPSSGTEPDCNIATDECDLAEVSKVSWLHTYMNAVDSDASDYRLHTCTASTGCSSTTYGDFSALGCTSLKYIQPYCDKYGNCPSPYWSGGYCSWQWTKNGVTKICKDYTMGSLPLESSCQ